MIYQSMKVLLAAGILTAASFQAAAEENNGFLQIASMHVEEIVTDDFNQPVPKSVYDRYYPDQFSYDSGYYSPDPTDKVGTVLRVGRDIVALGEDVYNLVTKGKPNVTTTYAPISVVPKVGGEAVDLLETEGWKLPRKRSYIIKYKNKFGVEVITFQYGVMWAYGGSFNGSGAYITAAQIIPERVDVLFGFDFTSTMKLGGIQNNGTRENPLAIATLLIENNASNILNSKTSVDVFVISGKGGLKKYQR